MVTKSVVKTFVRKLVCN